MHILAFHLNKTSFSHRIPKQNDPVAQLDRALVCGTKGHRFNSCLGHHFKMEHVYYLHMTDNLIKTKLRGHSLKFHTTWGLFSPKQIDNGTKLLLESIKIPNNADILDIGCGYGPIGISLAKDANSVHMVDKDFVAIEYTEKNISINGLDNCQTYLSNGLSKVPSDMKFNLIVSNIPAKVGKDLLLKILHDSKSHLKKGGKLYIVTIASLKEFMKRNLKEIFGNYKKLKHGKGYTAAMAENISEI